MGKQPDDIKISVIETSKANAQAELAAFLSDESALKQIQGAEDDLFHLDDPNVELNREMVKMGLAVDEYIDLLPQVTNLDHPAHARGLAKDMTELEIMRMLGLPQQVYSTIHGRNNSLSGFFGHLKARMGIVYPGVGMEIHPRGQLFGGLGKKESKADQGVRQRIASYFQ